MSKETNNGPLPDHLRRLEEFKSAIIDDVDPLFEDVAFRVLDNLDLAKRLRELDIMLKRADNLERLSAMTVEVSVYMWSNEETAMVAATEAVIEKAYILNGKLSVEHDDTSMLIENLQLTPLEKLVILDYHTDVRTGELYKHFRDIEFVFAKEGDGKT